MSVSFQELAGSPVEHYDLDGFRAERQFLIAWNDRDAFANEVLGIAVEHGGRTWAGYPGKSSVFAIRLRYEPFDPNSLDVQALPELTSGLNRYTDGFAKATVEYRTVNPRDRADGPENEAGTHLTYRMSFATIDQPITPRGWSWADNPAAVPDDLELVKTIPLTEHRLTWQQVVNPPWDAIRRLQGTVNATEFLGCPPGTLLFEGAEANKLFRSGFEAGASEFCWQIVYLFREKAIKQGSLAYGWNHAYRDDPPGWAELTAGSGPLYDLADFAPLFRSATA
ncbi:MAG: hypothetical protein HUU20_27100 [Pirellulales bacterium]|nr:hypothetical protein [Pirellulales bacterium]